MRKQTKSVHGNLYPIHLPRKIGGLRVPMHTFLVSPLSALFGLAEIRLAVSGKGFCFLFVEIK